MMNSKPYLLHKIVNSNDTDLKSLKHLHAKHVDDIADVMEEFATQTVIEVLQRLKRGEKVEINGVLYSAKSNKKKTLFDS